VVCALSKPRWTGCDRAHREETDMGDTNAADGVSGTGGTNGTERAERAVRAMLAAEAELVQERDLRPPTAFPPTVDPRFGRARGVVAVLGAAAATAGLLVGVRVLTTPPDTGPADRGRVTADNAAGLSVTFGFTTSQLTDPAATVTVPRPAVRADDPQVAQRVSQVLAEQIAVATGAFRSRIEDAEPDWPEPLRLDVTARTTTWRHYLTVRLDQTSVVGWERSETAPTLPIVEYAALVFDTRTGARVLPTDLFTDVDAAAAAVRAALVASRPDGDVRASELEALSLEPAEDGSTVPLSCYPVADGLHCLVDDGARTPDFQGRLEATVPWDELAGVAAPGVRP
jgi:hypothetical protein